MWEALTRPGVPFAGIEALEGQERLFYNPWEIPVGLRGRWSGEGKDPGKHR